MKPTKTDLVRQYFNSNKYLDALKIAKTFKLGLTKDEQAIIIRAHEMNSGNENFYTLLGFDKKDQLDKAIKILKDKIL